MAESAAAVHVVTTALVEDWFVPSPRSRRPPEVQLLRTFWDDTLGGERWNDWPECENRLGQVRDMLREKGCVVDAWSGNGRRTGDLAVKTPTTSRIEPQNRRPSWVVDELEVIVEKTCCRTVTSCVSFFFFFQAIVKANDQIFFASKAVPVYGPGISCEGSRRGVGKKEGDPEQATRPWDAAHMQDLIAMTLTPDWARKQGLGGLVRQGLGQ